MFESAEIGNAVGKREYARAVPGLRTELLAVQRALATSSLGAVVVVNGVEGAGKSETVNRLLEWIDARGVRVHAPWEPSDEERERPPMWRYWRLLPPRGTMSILFGSWYSQPILDRALNRSDDGAFDQALGRIVELERMLHAEDTLVIKFWMHLSKKRQKKRLKELAADPLQRWRVSKLDWKFFARYDKFQRVSAHALRRTSTAEAPWHVVEAHDARFRELTVARTLTDTLRREVARVQTRPAFVRIPDLPRPAPINVLQRLDAGKKVTATAYATARKELVPRIALHTRKLRERERSLIILFEGPDAAGKGGAIRRLTSAMDARTYQVMAVAAPTDEERAHPYLWRFWRQLPRRGRVTIFDRSWYGRVLVERIEGFCARDDWRRAFSEINAFEEQLAEFGTIVVKFWLALSPEEQLRRFKDRQTTPYKQYKLTEEDWRNRKKWDAYVAAACDTFEHTSTEIAPWTLIEADDKNHARLKVMRTVASRLEEALD